MIMRVPYLNGDGHLVIDFRLGVVPSQQIFSHCDPEGTYRYFDINRLYRIAAENPAVFPVLSAPIDPAVVEYIREKQGIEAEHVKGMTQSRVMEPGLILQFDDGTYVILDGNHRIVKRHAMGLPEMIFYGFSEPEATPAMLKMPDNIGRWLLSPRNTNRNRNSRSRTR